MHDKTELILTGPEGANPLGFLCAIGVLRTLDIAWPDAGIKLAWRLTGACWQPVLSGGADIRDHDGVVNAIFRRIKTVPPWPAKHWNDIHNIPAEEYRQHALDTVRRISEGCNREECDWVAAIASEVLQDAKGCVHDTAFRTMSGQGHQHFLQQMRYLTEALEPKHIAEALFDWRYLDEKLNLRFDPSEDRRHALRWKSPDKDPVKTVWGANALAVQALPLFPSFPVGRHLMTTGFSGRYRDDTYLTWPIWLSSLSMDAVRSVLALSELQADKPDKRRLFPLGIVEAYRSQRIIVGKYRAFSVACPVL